MYGRTTKWSVVPTEISTCCPVGGARGCQASCTTRSMRGRLPAATPASTIEIATESASAPASAQTIRLVGRGVAISGTTGTGATTAGDATATVSTNRGVYEPL